MCILRGVESPTSSYMWHAEPFSRGRSLVRSRNLSFAIGRPSLSPSWWCPSVGAGQREDTALLFMYPERNCWHSLGRGEPHKGHTICGHRSRRKRSTNEYSRRSTTDKPERTALDRNHSLLSLINASRVLLLCIGVDLIKLGSKSNDAYNKSVIKYWLILDRRHCGQWNDLN